VSEISVVKKAFVGSLERIDGFIESMKSQRDQIKAEFERRLLETND
jgi:hypothetical protein